MDLTTAIRKIKPQIGTTRDSYAVLCDLGAFNNEERSTRNIIKAMCEGGFLRQMALLSSSNNQWKATAHDIIYKMANQYGYQLEKVSANLQKLAIGLGLVNTSFDWESEFGPTTVSKTNITPVQPTATGQNNTKPTTRPQKKAHSTTKRLIWRILLLTIPLTTAIVLSLSEIQKMGSDDAYFAVFGNASLLGIAFLHCFCNDWTEIGPLSELLLCAIAGLLMVVLYALAYFLPDLWSIAIETVLFVIISNLMDL